MWAALLAAGHAVEVVVVGRNQTRLAAAARVLDSWVATPAACDAHCEAMAAELADRARREEEIASAQEGRGDASTSDREPTPCGVVQ